MSSSFVLLYWNGEHYQTVDEGTKEEMFTELAIRQTRFKDSKNYMVAIK